MLSDPHEGSRSGSSLASNHLLGATISSCAATSCSSYASMAAVACVTRESSYGFT